MKYVFFALIITMPLYGMRHRKSYDIQLTHHQQAVKIAFDIQDDVKFITATSHLSDVCKKDTSSVAHAVLDYNTNRGYLGLVFEEHALSSLKKNKKAIDKDDYLLILRAWKNHIETLQRYGTGEIEDMRYLWNYHPQTVKCLTALGATFCFGFISPVFDSCCPPFGSFIQTLGTSSSGIGTLFMAVNDSAGVYAGIDALTQRGRKLRDWSEKLKIE